MTYGNSTGKLSDSRQPAKVMHLMEDVVAIVFFALLSDIDEWHEMEMFAIDQRDVLAKYLKLPNGIPSHDTLERVISIIKPEELQKKDHCYCKEEEYLSDRTVIREYYLSEEIGWFADKKLWKKLTSIGYEKKVTKYKTGAANVEERYFLCSFRADAVLLSIAVRRHWHVENLLHWLLDVTFKEDSLTTRNKKALHNLGLIRRFVLSLLKALKVYYGNISYRMIRRHIGRKFDKEIPVIFSVFKVLYDQGTRNEGKLPEGK